MVCASVREDNPRVSDYCTCMHLHLVHYEIFDVKHLNIYVHVCAVNDYNTAGVTKKGL